MPAAIHSLPSATGPGRGSATTWAREIFGARGISTSSRRGARRRIPRQVIPARAGDNPRGAGHVTRALRPAPFLAFQRERATASGLPGSVMWGAR